MARIIVTSHSNLKEAVERGTFRRDLYGCLSVMSFHLQPLHKHVQDIAALVRATGKRFNAAFVEIHPLAMAALEAFPWPGNIPELENVLRQAVLRNTGRELLLEDLPTRFKSMPRSSASTARDKSAVPASMARTSCWSKSVGQHTRIDALALADGRAHRPSLFPRYSGVIDG